MNLYIELFMILRWLYRNNELLIWMGALLWLYCLPFMPGFLSSGAGFCPFRWAGLEWCPGCGLGRSISAAMHLDPVASWHFHKLGIPALLTLMYRIYYLTIPTKPKLHAKLSDEPA